METDAKLTRHVAHLARLDLTEEEVTLFSSQLGQILTYVEKLQNCKGASLVEPLYHPFFQEIEFRPDVITTGSASSASALADTILESAAEVQDRSFKVPKII